MQFKQHAIILAVIEALHRHNSWTGKTHVQKTISLLHEVTGVKQLVVQQIKPENHSSVGA